MTLDELRNLITQLQSDPASVSNEQLADARQLIQSTRDEQVSAAPSPEVVALLTELRDARQAVIGVQDARAADAARIQSETEELLRGLADEDATGETGGEQPADAAAPAGEGTAPAGDAPASEAGEQASAQTPELVAASAAMTPASFAAAIAAGIAHGFAQRETAQPAPAGQAAPQGRPAGRLGAHAATATPSAETAFVRVRAAGSGGAFQHGQEIGSTAELGRAFADRLRGAYKGPGGNGERMFVARVETAYPESRTLRPDDFDGNHGKIEAVASPTALVAAGGLCAPLETIYDVEVVGSTARPMRDSGLVRYGVDRGGIQFRPASSAAAAVNGAGIWTLDDDERVGVVETPTDVPDPVKGCYVVDCEGVEEATIQAIYSCLEFSNITARFDPEVTAANVQEALIAHARVAENALYNQVAAGSKLLRGRPQDVGAVRHVLGELDRAIAYLRNRHRIDTAVPLTWVAPAWFVSMARTDIAYQMAAGDWADALALADSMIQQWFARRGVTPVWHLDGTTDPSTVGAVTIAQQTYDNAAAGTVIPDYPDTVDSLLYPSGSWLFLDGGNLDLGLVRDSTLNARNRYRQFSEAFEGVADRGVESLRLVLDAAATGASSGTVAVVAS